MEEPPKQQSKVSDDDSTSETPPRHQQSTHGSGMRANMGRERSRKHRSEGSKYASKTKSKNTSAKRRSAIAPRDFDQVSQHHHTRNASNASNRGAVSSSSSEGEEEDLMEDHRTMMARVRLTSPSMVSAVTNQTTVTTQSGSSSGSNSTVTQSSDSKRSSSGKRVEVEDAPMSPAVPDPPANMFSFIDDKSNFHQGGQSGDEAVDTHKDRRRSGQTRWPKPKALLETAYEEPVSPNSKADHPSTSSSSSSSLHGDGNSSEHPIEHDTDRSSSPEWSDRGNDDSQKATNPTSDLVSDKIASQIAAARQRQGSWSSMQQFGTPDMPRGSAQLPHVPPSVLSSRSQYQVSQRPLPRAEKLPVTGYELLATTLASFSTADPDEPRIKPMYRKFEALNHRLLLHLQDELSELEEQLHRLDHADTQSRRLERHILPASRRAAAQAGGELQWHKTDILGRIGFKLGQYSMPSLTLTTTKLGLTLCRPSFSIL
jgi:hypothetical protein